MTIKFTNHRWPRLKHTRHCCALVCMLVCCMAHGHTDIQAVAQLSEVQQQLALAKATLVKVETAADDIVMAAELEAKQLKANAKIVSMQSNLDPLKVKNEIVAVELQSATIEEIANALMPMGWRVMVDVSDDGIKSRRFQFVTTKPRDQALAILVKTLGLKYQYFFDLADEEGVPTPLLVISEKNI
ncbi:MAG: hypothetical protein JKY67_22910 [Pseudomonadales bacterium]|nr:hypothetical protein [Pseudomonadales bacterium]